MITNYETLSRDTRIRLLGHYLSTMVSLMHAAELEEMEIKARLALDGEDGVTKSIPAVGLSANGEGIVMYLKRAGSASAREINRYGGIARSSMFRRLSELTERGVIGKTGIHKQTRYRLVNTGETIFEKNREDGAKLDSSPENGHVISCIDYCI